MDEELLQLCNITNEGLTNCSKVTRNETFPLHFGPEAVLVPLWFGIIFLTGIIGNVFLLFYILRKRSTTPHNLYVVCLAIGDLMMICIAMPFVSLIYTLPEWPFGESICKMSEFMQTVSTAVTIFTLTALSFERYLVLSLSKSQRSRTKSTMVVIIVIWVAAFVLGIPDIVSANVPNIGLKFCVPYRFDWNESFKFNKIMTLIKLFSFFIIPLCLIVPFYVMIFITLIQSTTMNKQFSIQRAEKINGLATGTDEIARFVSQSSSADLETEERKRKLVASLVFVLVIVFIACWLPRQIYLCWWNLDHVNHYNIHWHRLKIFGFCLMFANSSFNPIVFTLFDSGFRSLVKRFCLCGKEESFENASNEDVNQSQMQTIVLAEITKFNEPQTSV